MPTKKFSFLLVSAWAITCLGWALARSRASDAAVAPIQIGMVRTFFHDVPQSLVDWLPLPFSKLMKDHTGLDGKLVIGGDYYHVGKLLDEKKVQLGVFHGFEFAWAQSRFPELEPLMIAIYKHRGLRANLVVLKDNPAKGFNDLKGKNVALPMNSKGHCRLFLERSCQSCGQTDPKAFFHQLARPASVFAALDDLVDEKIHAAVVDGEFLESYKDLKPGNFEWLKVVATSEVFPSGVLACRKGGLDEATAARVRDGMIRAKESVTGRDLMLMFKISAFERPPSHYPQTLSDIIKTYPAPEPVAVKKMGNN